MECLQGVTFNSPSFRCILPKRRRRGHKIKPFRLINKIKMDQTSEANLLKAAADYWLISEQCLGGRMVRG